MDPESVSVPRNACLSFLTWDVGNVDRACETPRRQASSNEQTPFTMAAALLGKAAWLTAEHPHQSGTAGTGLPSGFMAPDPAAAHLGLLQAVGGRWGLRSACGGSFSACRPGAGTQRCAALHSGAFCCAWPGLLHANRSAQADAVAWPVSPTQPAQMREFGLRDRERTE